MISLNTVVGVDLDITILSGIAEVDGGVAVTEVAGAPGCSGSAQNKGAAEGQNDQNQRNQSFHNFHNQLPFLCSD